MGRPACAEGADRGRRQRASNRPGAYSSLACDLLASLGLAGSVTSCEDCTLEWLLMKNQADAPTSDGLAGIWHRSLVAEHAKDVLLEAALRPSANVSPAHHQALAALAHVGVKDV